MVVERWKAGLAVFALAISIGGCGADEPAAPPEETVDPGALDDGEKEICLFGMDCYDPDNSGPSGEEIFAEVENGFPAPGSECPIPGGPCVQDSDCSEQYGSDSFQCAQDGHCVECVPELDEASLVCSESEPWGFNLTQHMDNTQLVDCDGNPVYLHDEFCGATVGWLYFFRGAG
jgi:hypothetical protein